MRRLFRSCLWLALAALATACAVRPTVTPTLALEQMTHVRLAMGYLPSVQFAPFYVAAEKEYFRQAGIIIEFTTLFENDSAPLVGSNEMQFANISAEQVLQARAQGLPLVYVAAWFQEFPVAVVARSSAGVRQPADLRGKTIALPGLFGASYVGLRALLNQAAVPESEVTLQSIGFTQVEAFASGQADVFVGYTNNEPIQLQAQGQDVSVLRVSDYVPLAGNGLVTNEQTIRERPELVRGMVQALLRGLEDSLENPDEAFEISKRYASTLEEADDATLRVQRQVLDASLEMWKADRLGWTDQTKFEQTQQTLLQMGLLTQPLDLSQAYTNEFVP